MDLMYDFTATRKWRNMLSYMKNSNTDIPILFMEYFEQMEQQIQEVNKEIGELKKEKEEQ